MKNPVKSARYRVVLEPQVGGGYTVYVPELPGCVTEGRTANEALAMIKDAIAGYLAVQKEKGWNIPKVEYRQVSVA